MPHGYEGQGPGALERPARTIPASLRENNIQVCNLTTPAQYFHALRRQVKRDFRKPLIVMTPKSLLRHKDCVSPIEQLANERFHEVIDDSTVAKPERIRRVLMCSGKVYYDLAEKRKERKIEEVAIVRLEQFYPFPEVQVRQILSRYSVAREWVWVQEESQNMGGWSFVEPRCAAWVTPSTMLAATPAPARRPARLKRTKREQEELVDVALAAAVPHLVGASRTAPIRRILCGSLFNCSWRAERRKQPGEV